MKYLNNVTDIKEYSKKAKSTRGGVSEIKVLKELGRIAFASAANYINIETDAETGKEKLKYTDTSELSEDERAAIVSIQKTKDGIKIETADKLKALELLCKYFGMFSDSQSSEMKLYLTDEDKKLLERVSKRYAENN